jgi:hypothetical protein
MANVIYSKLSGKNDPMYGRFEHPIKMLIEKEADNQAAMELALKTIFNIEKSTKYAETTMGESDFDIFQTVREGQGAPNDTVTPTFEKTISHHAFMKEFTITKEMADDSTMGIAASIKAKPKKMVQAYFKTRSKFAFTALTHGDQSSVMFTNSPIDTTTGDGQPLFSMAHPFKNSAGTQSNLYHALIKTSGVIDAAKFEETLAISANKLRNFKDENGEAMDYTADIIIVPSNRPKLEQLVKKVTGSERTIGSGNNDINTQYGNWTVVVLPGWEAADDRFMIMSSAANENLAGNMFFVRKPLDIQSYVDTHTRNYIWNAYCRMGVGFNTWKHILLCKLPDAADSTSTDLLA